MLKHPSSTAGWPRQALAGLVLALAPGLALAGECTPPQNETCAGAIVFTNANLPLELTGSLGCVNDVIDRPYFDVFYRFDCTRSGRYEIEMCGSEGDTYLRIYSGGCGWADGEELAVADDECPGSPPDADPQLSIELQAGQSYWLEIGSWRPDPPFAPPPNAPYNLRVRLAPAPVPALPAWSVLMLLATLAAVGSITLRRRMARDAARG